MKTDTQESTVLMHRVAQLIAEHAPDDIFEVCMTLLAMNDVLSGYPDHTLANGRNKLMTEVYHLSLIVHKFMHNYHRIPTMAEVIDARHKDLQHKCDNHRQLH